MSRWCFATWRASAMMRSLASSVVRWGPLRADYRGHASTACPTRTPRAGTIGFGHGSDVQTGRAEGDRCRFGRRDNAAATHCTRKRHRQSRGHSQVGPWRNKHSATSSCSGPVQSVGHCLSPPGWRCWDWRCIGPRANRRREEMPRRTAAIEPPTRSQTSKRKAS